MATPTTLRIVIVAPDLRNLDFSDPAQSADEIARSRKLRIGLLEGGYDIVAVLPADIFLPDRLAQIDPDLIIIDAESQARDTLEHVVLASRETKRPIVLFTDDADTSHVPAAIAAGVTAYVVAGLDARRVRPVLDVAMARFLHEQSMRQELAEVRLQLSERKLVDQAKALLMTRLGLSEPEAYARLRKTAMDKGMKLAEVSQRVIDIADLLN